MLKTILSTAIASLFAANAFAVDAPVDATKPAVEQSANVPKVEIKQVTKAEIAADTKVDVPAVDAKVITKAASEGAKAVIYEPFIDTRTDRVYSFSGNNVANYVFLRDGDVFKTNNPNTVIVMEFKTTKSGYLAVPEYYDTRANITVNGNKKIFGDTITQERDINNNYANVNKGDIVRIAFGGNNSKNIVLSNVEIVDEAGVRGKFYELPYEIKARETVNDVVEHTAYDTTKFTKGVKLFAGQADMGSRCDTINAACYSGFVVQKLTGNELAALPTAEKNKINEAKDVYELIVTVNKPAIFYFLEQSKQRGTGFNTQADYRDGLRVATSRNGKFINSDNEAATKTSSMNVVDAFFEYGRDSNVHKNYLVRFDEVGTYAIRVALRANGNLAQTLIYTSGTGEGDAMIPFNLADSLVRVADVKQQEKEQEEALKVDTKTDKL